MLIGGFLMGNIADRELRIFVITMHKLSGMMILALMTVRLLWALQNVKPELPEAMPTWERIAERAVHGILYLALFLMPISGWIMSTAAGRPPGYYNVFNIPLPGIPQSEAIGGFFNTMHKTLAWVLVIFVTIHILAALKHHIINKDNTLRRMLPCKSKS